MTKRTMILVSAIALLGNAAFAASHQENQQPAASDTPSAASDDNQVQLASQEPGEPRITHEDTGFIAMRPRDIPDDKGFFIYSADGQRAFRMYGSLRMLAVFDDRQNFHAFDLNLPQIPTGGDDFRDVNAIWTANETKFGFDALIGTGVEKGLLARMEFDFKGTDEKFRVRHAFLRGPHFLVGQVWSSFNNVEYLPLTVDGHYLGGGLGIRPAQFRYYGSVLKEKLQYQVSAEFKTAKLVKPDTVDAEARVVVPAIAGQITYPSDWGQVGGSVLIKPNRVQFTGASKRVDNILGFGGLVGAKFNLGTRNRLLLSAHLTEGSAGFAADWAFTASELIYNPNTGEFENQSESGGYVGYEHGWTEHWSSTIGVGFIGVDLKDYQPGTEYNDGYKAVVNVFWRPKNQWDGLVIGAETEYAERTNKDNSTNRTTRVNILVYYDF